MSDWENDPRILLRKEDHLRAKRLRKARGETMGQVLGAALLKLELEIEDEQRRRGCRAASC